MMDKNKHTISTINITDYKSLHKQEEGKKIIQYIDFLTAAFIKTRSL